MADVQHAALADAELHTAYPNGTDPAATYDATPDIGDFYFETDTGILSYCYTDNVWSTVAEFKLANELQLSSALQNSATNPAAGLMDGCTMIRAAAGAISVTAGTVAIGDKLYQELATVALADITQAWAASGLDGGLDSGTTINNGDRIFVYLTTTTGDPDGWQIGLSESRSPTDFTEGVDARLIGSFIYLDGTTKIQSMVHYRPWGIFGWDFITGTNANAVVKTVTHGVTMKSSPIPLSMVVGSLTTATPPVGTMSFTGQADAIVQTNSPIQTTFRGVVTGLNGANLSSASNFGFTFKIEGDWA